MLNLDFSSVPDRSPLEEGIYVLQIAKVEEKESAAKNPMLSVEYDVIGIEGTRKIWDNYVLTPKAMWKLKELFDALSIPTEEIVSMDVSELVGLQLKAKVIQELYQGEPQNRVKKLYSID